MSIDGRESHSRLLLLIQMLWPSALRMQYFYSLYNIVFDEIKCDAFGLSCKCNKIWEWSECGKKAKHKKWIEKKSFSPLWHAWDLNAWCSCDRSFLYLFHYNPNSHNSWGTDWLLWHFILSYEIKYTAGGLSCVRSKSQQLWLLRSALDRGETCSDELLAAWSFQVQQILSKTRVGFNKDKKTLMNV